MDNLSQICGVEYATGAELRTKVSPRVVSSGAALRSVLSGVMPGGWASDHRAEANRFTGWHYVAIRAIAIQFMQADVEYYADHGRREAKTKRKSLRSSRRFKAFSSQDPDTTPLSPDSPIMRLTKRPNPGQSGASFRYEIGVQLNLTGSVLIWNVPNKLGKTVQRYVIPMAIAQPVAPSHEFPQGSWRITPEGSHWGPEDGWFMDSGMLSVIGKHIPAEQIQIIRWPHPIYRDDGQSPVAAGALWSDSADMVDKRRWSHLKRGANPSAIVTDPEFQGNQAEADGITKALNAAYGGPNNDGKIIFTNGDKVWDVGHTAQEMAYQEAFLQLRDATLALHGTPGVAAGVTDGGSYAAFYAALLQFTRLTMQPQLDLVAEEETEKLAPQFGEGLTCEMLAADIDDPATLEQELRTDVSAGIRTRDEFRSIRGLPPMQDKRLGSELVGGDVLQNDSGQIGDGTGIPGVPRLGRFSTVSVPTTQDDPEPTLGTTDAGVQTDMTLNGAQITAARDILLDVGAGNITEQAAIELLVAVGIPRDTAQSIVRAQIKLPKPAEAEVNSDPLPKNRFAGNGHATTWGRYP